MPGEGHEREWDHDPRAEADHWSLMIPVADGRGRPYAPRPISFGSLARPFRGAGADTRVVSLFLPRDLFGDAAAALDMAAGRPPDTGATALLADFVLLLERRLAEGGAELGAEALASATRRIVAAGLAPSPARMSEARSLLQAGLVERMMRDIRRDLASPDLGWATLSARYGISRSALHRLFEPYGGVWSFIRGERLRAVRREIERAGSGAVISRIAERYGFHDASGFSRMFRRAFGCSPRDVAAGSAGDAATAGEGQALPPLDAFLHGLRESAGEG
jgi:AraC-like DNA-binding protein